MIYHINKFSGGISDYEDKGIPGAFKFGKNLNIRRITDSLYCQQALREEGSGVFTDLIRWFVKCSDGNLYGFGSSGKIYKRTNGVWSVVYTDPDGEIKGAEELVQSNGTKYLGWCNNTKIKRKPIPGLSNWSDVSTLASNLTSAKWHTMKQIAGATKIANYDKLAMVGYDGSWTNEALALIPGNIAKTIIERNGRTIIGCYKVNEEDRGINSQIDAEFPLIQVGNDGDIYLADMSNTIPIKRFPGGGKTNPGGVCNYYEQPQIFEWEETALSWIDKQEVGNLAYFGVYGGALGYNGIYSIGRLNKNRPFVLNLDYSLEADEIGAIVNFNGTLIASYKSGLTYGVKSVDPSNKAIGVYEGLDLKIKPKGISNIVQWKFAELTMYPLPSGCSVEFWFRIDKNGNFVQAKTIDGANSYNKTGGKKAHFSIQEEGEIFEPRVVLNPNGNVSPEVYDIKIYFD